MVPSNDGTWRVITRDEVKRRFRSGDADVLLCTDAAAEGLYCATIWMRKRGDLDENE